jgi:hypothetical protein
MSLLPFGKNIDALILRASASLERADLVMEEVQRAAKNANELILELRAALAALRNKS